MVSPDTMPTGVPLMKSLLSHILPVGRGLEFCLQKNALMNFSKPDSITSDLIRGVWVETAKICHSFPVQLITCALKMLNVLSISVQSGDGQLLSFLK